MAMVMRVCLSVIYPLSPSLMKIHDEVGQWVVCLAPSLTLIRSAGEGTLHPSPARRGRAGEGGLEGPIPSSSYQSA